MPDDIQNAEGYGDNGATPDEAQIERWIAEQQARLDRGEPLNAQGIPPGYEVENGKIVRKGWWEEWGKGAVLGMGAGIAGGVGAGLLNGAMAGGAGAAGAGAGGAGISAPAAAPFATLPGAIPASGAAGAAVLPSTAIGGIGALPAAPASGSAIAANAGGGGIMSSLIPSKTDAISSILGKAAGSRQNQKNKDAELQLVRDRSELDRYLAGLQAPGTRMKTSARASYAANAAPVKAEWGGPGSGKAGKTVKFNGGYSTPLDDRTKALANDILEQELMEQRSPNHGGPPPVAPAPKSSFWDKLLGGAATAASIYSGIK